jgi:hypothetical protein
LALVLRWIVGNTSRENSCMTKYLTYNEGIFFSFLLNVFIMHKTCTDSLPLKATKQYHNMNWNRNPCKKHVHNRFHWKRPHTHNMNSNRGPFTEHEHDGFYSKRPHTFTNMNRGFCSSSYCDIVWSLWVEANLYTFLIVCWL